jgi:hypothetical protein
MTTAPADSTYTMIRAGKVARQVPAAAAVLFDVDDRGTLLGAHASPEADWFSALLMLAASGRVRLADSPGEPG